ncbi:TetR/AcrR family transcriptional regulator [Paenibacillus profundus]|uniref:TetR/AcrR family transcriptional regulator n=1 Tax=Paenibacillus profundus TaxID=1173085 RepID=A0ABS8YE63_9BACL|nr:TetR/AcrR family transcriptional regulator [Paenibacillus profundus]MCE5169966.1 TetR/AcrR family transcriptional regulator [Paenibacillus profundus]
MSRVKILNAAADVFSTHGYQRASMDEIAMQANVAKGTLYYHFSGKAQLFQTLVTEGMSELVAKIRSDLNTDVTLEEQIKRIVQHHLDLYLDNGALARIVFYELSNGLEDEVLENIQQIHQEYIRFLTEVLEMGRAEGMLRSVNSRLAAVGIIGMIEHVCAEFLTEGEHLAREQLEEVIITIVTSGLIRKVE